MKLKLKIITILSIFVGLTDFVYACSGEDSLSDKIFPYSFFIIWGILILLYLKRTIRLIKEGKTKTFGSVIKGLIIAFFIIELLYSIYQYNITILICG